MKNVFKSIAVIIVFTLTSCGTNTPQMNSKEGLEKIKDIAIENFGKDQEVYSLTIYSQGDLNSDLGMLTVKYLKEGKRYSRTYANKTEHTDAKLYDEELDSDTFQKPMYLKKAQGKLKINDLDVSIIISNIDKALQLMGDDVDTHQLKSYTINADSKTNEISSTFELHVTQKGEGTSIEGRNIVTNFYEANFEADAQGNVVMTD